MLVLLAFLGSHAQNMVTAQIVIITIIFILYICVLTIIIIRFTFYTMLNINRIDLSISKNTFNINQLLTRFTSLSGPQLQSFTFSTSFNNIGYIA